MWLGAAGASTPNVVYYQCYTHQKLGWRLVKEGSPEAMEAISTSGNAQLMADAGAQAPAGTVTEANPACASGPLSVAGMPTQFDCGVEVPGGGKVLWTHDAAANVVTFGVEMPNSGWVGLGFNPPDNAFSMVGSMVRRPSQLPARVRLPMIVPAPNSRLGLTQA